MAQNVIQLFPQTMSTQQQPQQPDAEALLRLPEVMRRTGLSRSTIYERMGQEPPTFPRCRRLGPRVVVWPSSAIDRFVAEVAAGAAS